MHAEQPTGVLLVQLGTPDSTEIRDVRRYLKEFLSDERVLDMPALLRWLLLRAVILPFRPKRSAEAYRKIWMQEGSPLLLNTEALCRAVGERLGDAFRVEVAMRYGLPSIEGAVGALVDAGVDRIVVFPLFPQYSSAATGSAVEKVLDVIGSRRNVPQVVTIGSFYDDPRFVRAVAEVARPLLDSFRPDHVLFSFHGLPETQVRKADPTGGWCLATSGCCERIVPSNRYCYRAQCFATTRAVAGELGLGPSARGTSFQSRLAGQQWITPFTDAVLPELYASGVRRLAVLTPSFTSDCLETLEEIGIRGRRQWEELGGEAMLLVPCVNVTPAWVAAVADMVQGLS